MPLTLNYLFLGGLPPPCLDAADVNGDAVDISDALRLLSYLFLSGSPPGPPGPHVCGPDSNDDDLGCASLPLCE